MHDPMRAGLARAVGASLRGLDAVAVRVEVDLAPDLPAFSLVGLPSVGVREARERIGAALRHAGYHWPNGRVTVNLAPAEVRKDGAALDLAIAAAILLASGQLRHPGRRWLGETLFAAELALDGALRAPRGLVALALDARELGLRRLVVPHSSAALLRSLTGLETVGIARLEQLRSMTEPVHRARPERFAPVEHARHDDALSRLRGQERALRAAAIAAAGGHHLAMLGPPGCGKTLLARALWSLLPRLDDASWRSRLRIESCAGLPFDPDAAWEAPFRSPHHSVSAAGLVGGGRPLRAGEITLAHGGLLFLDEFSEFAPRQLDMLREPMETRRVRLSRQGQSLSFPAGFQLVAAANPCPCGFANSRAQSCSCAAGARRRYASRISGPLRDRIELWVEMDRVPAQLLLSASSPASCGSMRARVRRAVEAGARESSSSWEPSPGLRHCLMEAGDRLQMSARAMHAALRVARTIALLDGLADPGPEQLAEACAYRPPSLSTSV